MGSGNGGAGTAAAAWELNFAIAAWTMLSLLLPPPGDDVELLVGIALPAEGGRDNIPMVSY